MRFMILVKASADSEAGIMPSEELITAMRMHQKYFALTTAEGALAPRFLVVDPSATMSSRPMSGTGLRRAGTGRCCLEGRTA